MIKAVVFDMDGLLFDTERLGMDIITPKVINGMGYDITRDIILKTIGRNRENEKNVFHKYIDENLDYEEYITTKLKLVHEYVEEHGMPKKKGVDKIIKFLKGNNYKIAVATSSSRDIGEYHLKKGQIYDYFDAIVYGDMILTGKPEPEIYLKAAQLIGVEASSCIAVEDSPAGLLSAYRAGMKPIMVPDLIEPDAKTEKILYDKCNDLIDVMNVIKSLI